MQTRSPVQFNSVALAGERVRLVPISDHYAQTIFEEFTDDITRLMVPATPTHIDQIHEFICASSKSMQDNVDLIFAITEKNSGEFLGVCGLHGRVSPREPVLGIWLKKAAHGNHFGQEAIKVLAGWAREHLVFDYMIYPCDRDNIPSRKIAESLNGEIFRTGEVKTQSGRILNEVAYKIT